MKRILAVIIFTFVNAHIFAQFSSEKFSLEWTIGTVVFKTGDTLNCSLRYNQTGNKPILQVREAGHTLTVPVTDVKEFSFFDSKRNRKRVFSAFENPEITGQEFFMEKIYAGGSFSILNWKTLEVPMELNFSRFVGKPVKTHKKFLRNESTGELLPLSRENLLELLQPKRSEILSYVKSNHLRFKRISDFISVFEYHNSL